MTEVDANTASKEPIEGGNVGMGTQYLEVRGLTVDFDGLSWPSASLRDALPSDVAC